MDDIQTLLHEDIDEQQLSPDVLAILPKLARGEQLTRKEEALLLNPHETAAILSVKYHTKVRPRYVKELARAVPSKRTGHVTPARLTAAKIAGRTHLYTLKDVLAVPMRQKISA